MLGHASAADDLGRVRGLSDDELDDVADRIGAASESAPTTRTSADQPSQHFGQCGRLSAGFAAASVKAAPAYPWYPVAAHEAAASSGVATSDDGTPPPGCCRLVHPPAHSRQPGLLPGCGPHRWVLLVGRVDGAGRTFSAAANRNRSIGGHMPTDWCGPRDRCSAAKHVRRLLLD
jgi:hypothetical protein